MRFRGMRISAVILSVFLSTILLAITGWADVITPITLHGNSSNQASTLYTFGTSHDSNPAIGLDFKSTMSVDYDWNLPYNIVTKPITTHAGTQITPSPYSLSLNGTPSFSFTSENVAFSTNFFFDLNVDMLITDLQVHIDKPLPNVPLGGLGYITSHGNGSLSASGSSYTDMSASWGDGTVKVAAGSDSMGAWAAGIDLIAAAASFGIGNPATNAVDLLGFDLTAYLGMNIALSESNLYLTDYRFVGSQSVEIPEGTAVGTYTGTATAALYYTLVFESDFDYTGEVGLSFDGPFFDPVVLAEGSIGTLDAGHAWSRLDMKIGDVPFSYEYEVVELNHILPEKPVFELNPPDDNYFAVNLPDPVKTLPSIQYQPVPEPATMLLLGSGLVGLAGLKRKFR